MRNVRGLMRCGCLATGLAAALLCAVGFGDEPKLTIFASAHSKIYHVRLCSAGQQVSQNTAVHFKTEAEAKATGRRLCRMCAELLDKETKNKAAAAKQPDRPVKQGDPPAATRPVDETDGPIDVPVTAAIKKVLSGGTLVTEGEDRMVLTGILCPQAGQSFSKETMRFIREQTRGRRVRVRAPVGGARRDALGRLEVYLFAQPGERDLGDELLYQGLAWLDREAALDRRVDYLKQEDEAWWAHRGVWKPLEGEAGQRTVVIGRNAHHYHAPDCPHVAQLTQARNVTVNEAKARRLTPCENYHDDSIAADTKAEN